MLCVALMLLSTLDADPSFQEGLSLYRSTEYEQAVLRFQEISIRSSLTPPERATALLYLGLSYAGVGDFDAARRNFGDALRSDASIALPDDTPPRVRALFDDVKKVVAQEQAPPPPPPQPPPPQKAPERGNLVLAGGAVAAGAVALVGGVVLGVLSSVTYASANDPNAFQDDAKRDGDTATGELVAAAILIPVGAALAGAGAFMLME